MVASYGGHNFRKFMVINTTNSSMNVIFSAALLRSLCWRAYRQVLCCVLLDSAFRNNWEQWVSRFMILPLWTWKGWRSACQSTKGKWCLLKMWPPSEVQLSGIIPRYVHVLEHKPRHKLNYRSYRTQGNLFTSHWITKVPTVLCFILQKVLTHVNDGSVLCRLNQWFVCGISFGDIFRWMSFIRWDYNTTVRYLSTNCWWPVGRLSVMCRPTGYSGAILHLYHKYNSKFSVLDSNRLIARLN